MTGEGPKEILSSKTRQGSSVANIILGDFHSKKDYEDRSWNLAYLEVEQNKVLPSICKSLNFFCSIEVGKKHSLEMLPRNNAIHLKQFRILNRKCQKDLNALRFLSIKRIVITFKGAGLVFGFTEFLFSK